MSPLPSFSAAPSPQRAGLQAVPPPSRPSRWPVALVLVLAVGIAAWQFRARSQREPSPASLIRTVKVVRGNLQRTLRVSGSVSARTFSNIFAPIVQAPDFG